MSAPVRHTCPDIDRIKDNIRGIIKEMDSIVSDDDELNSAIFYWRNELANIGLGNRCELEDLRQANSSLRDWGHDTEIELEELKTQNYILEKEVESLKDEIEDMQSQIEI